VKNWAQTRPDVEAVPEARFYLVALALTALIAALYWTILRDLARQWLSDGNYNHGFLVPPFTAFLLWRQRERLRAIPPRGASVGIVVVLAGAAALLVGDIAAENFLMRSSLVVILAGLVLFHLGPEILKVVAFPLGFLLFMVPLPATLLYAITFPLQSLAAAQAAWLLDLLGIPVLLDGNVIHLAQISLGVTEACSGIRSLISLVAGAAAWAYLTLPGGIITILFVLSAVPITILANAGRVVTTGLIGQWLGVEYASGFFHDLAGWVVYAFAFACLAAVHSLLGRARLVTRGQ
jgi:exosortase